MTDTEKLLAIEAIKTVKSRYFRGVDCSESELVRGILAEDCELDYRGCCTDPTSGKDYFPALNIVMQGRDSWSSEGFAKAGIVSVHQSHNHDIELLDEYSAKAIWSMTDRLIMPEGSDYKQMTGYGYYHETYKKYGKDWKIQTLRIERLWVGSE